jgi:protein MBA1
MSRPLALPIRLLSQTIRQNASSTQCFRQRSLTRSFTTTPARARAVMPKIRQPAQPSISRTQKEQQATMIRSGQVPDDVGLLQDTFILPRKAEERWSWKLRKQWLKKRFVEIYGMAAFKWLIKPRPKLEVFEIAPKAARAHREMYHLFADGNVDSLERRVCSGLFGSLRRRVLQRAPNTYLRWEIKKELSPPALCSFKAAVLPGGKGEQKDERNAQIQAVVKLHTLQSLQHVKRISKREGKDGKGAIVTREEDIGNEEEKESVEYVVMQRTIRKGKLGEWQIWGFTEETSLAQVEKELAAKM